MHFPTNSLKNIFRSHNVCYLTFISSDPLSIISLLHLFSFWFKNSFSWICAIVLDALQKVPEVTQSCKVDARCLYKGYIGTPSEYFISVNKRKLGNHQPKQTKQNLNCSFSCMHIWLAHKAPLCLSENINTHPHRERV